MVFFVKKSRPFLNAGYIMYTISIFYFTFYLFFGEGRVVHMHPTHPPPCLRAWRMCCRPAVRSKLILQRASVLYSHLWDCVSSLQRLLARHYIQYDVVLHFHSISQICFSTCYYTSVAAYSPALNTLHDVTGFNCPVDVVCS